MSTFEKKEVLLQTIGELFHKMDKGNLSIDEMQILVESSRQLYDRSVIMQYKALEAKVLVSNETQIDIAQPTQEEVEQPKEVEEEQPTIDFSIFDNEEESKIEFDIPSAVQEEPELKEELKQPETISKDQSEEVKSFHEKFSGNTDNSLSSQFGSGKLESLVDAFGFNEKLQVINDLFGGDRASFDSTINTLDTAASADSARQFLSELAVKHSWDLENKLTESFVNKVERRHV